MGCSRAAANFSPVSGIVKSDGQSLTFDAVKGKIGGGEVTASVDARPGANGIDLNARVEFSGVDGTALRYRNLAMPAGRASMQMTLTSQGRSASALAGALSGSGTLTLEQARFAGLDLRAFEVAVRASDSGQVKDEARLKQIVEPALLAGALAIPSAQIPFTIRDGRLRVGATTLDATGVRAIVSGGYDIPADQADIRAALALTMTAGRPEIQLFAAGTPDALTRSVDVTGAFLVAGGAGDRLRDPKARRHRTRRTAAAAAGADIAPAHGGAGAFGSNAAEPGTSAGARPRCAAASGEAKDCAAPATAPRCQCAARAVAASVRLGAGCATAAADRREARAGCREAETQATACVDAAGRQSAAAAAAEQQLERFQAKHALGLDPWAETGSREENASK